MRSLGAVGLSGMPTVQSKIQELVSQHRDAPDSDDDEME